MKFSSNVDALSDTNKHLRSVVRWLLAFECILGMLVIVESDHAPVYLERTSRGIEILAPTVPARTPRDLKRMAELALKARFDTQAESAGLFLSARQMELRESEQREMKARSLSQAVVVRDVEISSERAVVDVDRVLAMGEVRSALRVRLRLAFEETEPNELNPYGFRLAMAEPIDAAKVPGQDKENKKEEQKR
jgi:hypothetical protein